MKLIADPTCGPETGFSLLVTLIGFLPMDSFCWLHSGGGLAYSFLLHKLPILLKSSLDVKILVRCKGFLCFLLQVLILTTLMAGRQWIQNVTMYVRPGVAI